MDPLGLLLAVVALGVYPGGLFVGCTAWLTRRLSGMPRGSGVDARGLAAMAAAVLAASMAALPGSPAASLPPSGGAAPDLIAAVLLLFAAGSLVAPEPWSRRRELVVVLGGVSLLLLGLSGASFSMSVIAGLGGEADLARVVVATGVLLALPVIVQPHRGGQSAARAVVLAATVEVVLGTQIPTAVHGVTAVLWVVGLVAAQVVYALLLRIGRRAAQGEHLAVVGLAAVCACAGSLAAILAAHA